MSDSILKSRRELPMEWKIAALSLGTLGDVVVFTLVCKELKRLGYNVSLFTGSFDADDLSAIQDRLSTDLQINPQLGDIAELLANFRMEGGIKGLMSLMQKAVKSMEVMAYDYSSTLVDIIDNMMKGSEPYFIVDSKSMFTLWPLIQAAMNLYGLKVFILDSMCATGDRNFNGDISPSLIGGEDGKVNTNKAATLAFEQVINLAGGQSRKYLISALDKNPNPIAKALISEMKKPQHFSLKGFLAKIYAMGVGQTESVEYDNETYIVPPIVVDLVENLSNEELGFLHEMKNKNRRVVAINMGSMHPTQDSSEFVSIISKSLEILEKDYPGEVAVFLVNSHHIEKSLLGNLSDNFYISDGPVNLHELFSRCSLICHGGVGTAQIAVETGAPTKIAQFIGDQLHSGKKIQTLQDSENAVVNFQKLLNPVELAKMILEISQQERSEPIRPSRPSEEIVAEIIVKAISAGIVPDTNGFEG